MEARVAAIDEVPAGAMRKVMVGDKPCLLVHLADGLHAYPAECPHYHGPLADGVLNEGRVTCPWHQAVYSAASGDLLEPPSFFALPPYQVRVADGSVYVEVAEDARAQRVMPMTSPRAADDATAVLVGAGAAGAAAAEALRQAGFGGRVVMIGAEDRVPYDRPNCSKDLLAGTMPASWMPLRSPSFYERNAIERLSTRVESLDVASRTVALADGVELRADALLLAPGSEPRRLAGPGTDLPQVFTLRSWDDCEAIVATLDGAQYAVVVGASFIGLEAAAALRHRGLDVTVVGPELVPFGKLLGEQVGAMLRTLHEERGVRFRLGRVLETIEGSGRVRSVTLSDGEELRADVVLAGIGVRPATAFLHGLDLLPDGSIPVDERLRAAPGVWAAGDVASFPAAHLGEERVRIEHWRLALQHGRAAAFDIAGRGEPFAGVPFFWTQQYDVLLGFAGYSGGWDRLVATGDVGSRDFVVYQCDGERVRAAYGTRQSQLAAFAELMRNGRVPPASELVARPDLDLLALMSNSNTRR
jgi:NADPH-dependent 2,4-dienoyl-CoA reductase/sulfur reductase-like enzyme/nitrite reductase/ring-hydroxylating ferredoxin subunit